MSVGSEVMKDPTSIVSPINVFYLLLLPIGILWFTYWRLSRRHMYQLAEKLPGIEGLPVVGNLFDVFGTSHCK